MEEKKWIERAKGTAYDGQRTGVVRRLFSRLFGESHFFRVFYALSSQLHVQKLVVDQ
jgi:hypothetical protein